MTATRMDHFTILTDDLAATLAFYDKFVGLKPGPRPPFGFDGAWLYAADGAHPILHVIAGQEKSRLVAGVIDHIAFFGQDLVATVNRLRENGEPYELRRLPRYETWQLFFHDPNGAKVEIDFDPGEPAPAGH